VRRERVRREVGAASAALLLAGCGAPDALAGYTDDGDACQQVVSAIGYADTLLKPLGQEPYQDFDDATRSRLAAVGGTISLEVHDWPTDEIADQARAVQPLAERLGGEAGGSGGAGGEDGRTQVLLDYRLEATRLVQLCRERTGA
jgi:hypothetical protein